MPGWTTERVLSLAPDAASAKAGRKLGDPAPWSEAGADEEAVWGLCRGSGQRPYQTQVDLSEPAFRCSCPSRKFPCKHALGLLLLWTERPAEVSGAEPPDWVSEWLAGRRASAGDGGAATEPGGAARAPGPGARVVDPEAQAKRRRRREERTAAGVEELRRWLGDLVRAGLASTRQESYGFWDGFAARMVDAQAPGLAARVRRLAGVVAAGEDRWTERLLEELSLLYLLAEAHGRSGELPDSARRDVEAALGWTVPREEVVAGARERDRWTVLARSVHEEDRLRIQRTWLWAGAGERPALVLDFAPLGQSLDASLPVGFAVDAELAFYPGSTPLRAVVAEAFGEPAPLTAPPRAMDLGSSLAAVGSALGGNPWLDRLPAAIGGVLPALEPGVGLELRVDGRAVTALAGERAAWRLLAVSGGEPVTVFGEWLADGLAPLSAFAEGRLVEL